MSSCMEQLEIRVNEGDAADLQVMLLGTSMPAGPGAACTLSSVLLLGASDDSGLLPDLYPDPTCSMRITFHGASSRKFYLINPKAKK